MASCTWRLTMLQITFEFIFAPGFFFVLSLLFTFRCTGVIHTCLCLQYALCCIISIVCTNSDLFHFDKVQRNYTQIYTFNSLCYIFSTQFKYPLITQAFCFFSYRWLDFGIVAFSLNCEFYGPLNADEFI